jgi:hypothetical protein
VVRGMTDTHGRAANPPSEVLPTDAEIFAVVRQLEKVLCDFGNDQGASLAVAYSLA